MNIERQRKRPEGEGSALLFFGSTLGVRCWTFGVRICQGAEVRRWICRPRASGILAQGDALGQEVKD